MGAPCKTPSTPLRTRSLIHGRLRPHHASYSRLCVQLPSTHSPSSSSQALHQQLLLLILISVHLSHLREHLTEIASPVSPLVCLSQPFKVSFPILVTIVLRWSFSLLFNQLLPVSLPTMGVPQSRDLHSSVHTSLGPQTLPGP